MKPVQSMNKMLLAGRGGGLSKIGEETLKEDWQTCPPPPTHTPRRQHLKLTLNGQDFSNHSHWKGNTVCYTNEPGLLNQTDLLCYLLAFMTLGKFI